MPFRRKSYQGLLAKLPNALAGMLMLSLVGCATAQIGKSVPKPLKPVHAGPADDTMVQSIIPVLEHGGRLDWDSATGKVLVDLQGEDEYFDIYLMNEDGSDPECLTCDHPQLPNKSIGNPAFHPSGQFMVFQAQNDYRGIGRITDWFANPGSGGNNDVFIMNLETRAVTKITDTPVRSGGVLHAHFSPSGKKLLWSERYTHEGHRMGLWKICIADVALQGDQLAVSNIQSYRPGRQKIFYETHCFSPDEKSVFFSGFLEPKQGYNVQDVYRYNYVEDQLHRLSTTMDHWDEHAHLSPTGKHVVWMSSMGVEKPRIHAHTDYWVMDPDGSNQRRLTYFNEKGHPHYIEGGAVSADFAWSKDGKRILAYLILSFNPHRAVNVMIEFKEAL